jgi:hypothetical protein
VKDDREFRNTASSILLCDGYLTTVCKTSFIIPRKAFEQQDQDGTAVPS